jgi:hypothetical protein
MRKKKNVFAPQSLKRPLLELENEGNDECPAKSAKIADDTSVHDIPSMPNEDKLDSEIVAEDSMESRLSSISKDSLSRLSHEDMNSDTKESNSEKLNPLSIGNGLKNSFKGILKAAIDKVHSDSDISSNLDTVYR